MDSESVTSSPSRDSVENARALFGEHPADVIEMVGVGAERLFELSSLFKAIQSAADSSTEVENLCCLGAYIANDTGNLLDERREHYRSSYRSKSEA